jgi:hypothetical protein
MPGGFFYIKIINIKQDLWVNKKTDRLHINMNPVC